LNSAESRVKLANIRLAQVEKEHLRNVELYDKGVIAIEEYEKSETTLLETQEELQSANDNLEITKTGITKNNASISNTQIRATIDGMILDIPVKKGNSVIQANTFNDGTTIASIADMSDIIFKGKVDETDVNRLKENMPVNVRIGAMQDVNLNAVLEYISPKAVEENNINMFEVKIAVTVPDSIQIRAGYSANADVITEQRIDILCIPESTIEFKEDKKIVHVLTSDEDDKEQVFEDREIETGISDGINIEIIKGVTAEDKIRN
ncbi:MAG: HlyD family efflux transporter periplasmic adaptor subunit, partial [Bacteroidetes bacterium]|nr:HlyD family efflux transporter periplasmic adaptor subunit [Bacteroidota bacterium]